MSKRKAESAAEEDDVSLSKKFSSGAMSGVATGVKLPPGVKVVWQLEEKQSWFSYLGEVQESLTTALVTGHKIVRLEAGPRSPLAVHLDTLCQVNNKDIRKRVRGLVTEDGNYYSWEVQDKTGTWSPLPVLVSGNLEHLRNISPMATISLDNVVYDLTNMVRRSDNATIRREYQFIKNITKSSITFKIKLAKSNDYTPASSKMLYEVHDEEEAAKDKSPASSENPPDGDQKKNLAKDVQDDSTPAATKKPPEDEPVKDKADDSTPASKDDYEVAKDKVDDSSKDPEESSKEELPKDKSSAASEKSLNVQQNESKKPAEAKDETKITNNYNFEINIYPLMCVIS